MLEERQFLSIRELSVGGLFAALIAAGAFIKVTLPAEPFPMHFTLQWFFVLLAGLLLNKRLAGQAWGCIFWWDFRECRCLPPEAVHPT